MADEVDLTDLLDQFEDHVKTELASKPTVEDVGDDLDLDDLAVTARRWTRVDEIVAVVADLKDSTKLGTGKQHAASTASIYEAAINPLVRMLDTFGADDIAIQGDGAIGIFWGDMRFERAMAAGITVKTFSRKTLIPRLEEKWSDLPPTGFKVGVAASRILVKRIGIPRTEERQEEVWAGKAVNYAAKAGQSVDRHELIVTDTVWNAIESNDYIVYSCSCGNGPSDTIWTSAEIDKLPEPDRYGRKLWSQWCDVHGAEFCEAIMTGEKKRPEVDSIRRNHLQKLMEDSLRTKAKQARDRRNALGRLRTG